MAEGMTSDDAFELKSVMQQILAQMKDSAVGTTEYSRRTSELIAHGELNREVTRRAAVATERNSIQLESLAKNMTKLGKEITRVVENLNKTQQDLGISLASAGKLQADLLINTAMDAVDIFKNTDYQAVGSGILDIITGFGGTITSGGDVSSIRDMLTELTKPIPGKAPSQLLLPSERMGGIKSLQAEFGVINKSMGENLAQTAKNYGVSVDQLVKARRTFATIARGDLSQVDTLQNKFFARFKQAGMERNVALEAITRYADLIARNGKRFADSFARAAADAKKIGVDLGKVDQFGDNIIDNFEGFLESQAELGAMGFGFDTSRLAEVAITGDTGALYDELRSQLAMTGKDINNLNRAERLSLEGIGIDIATMQRMAGDTPEITSEKLAEDSNSKLAQILTLFQAGGPVLMFLGNALENIVAALNPLSNLKFLGTALIVTLFGAAAAYKMGNDIAGQSRKLKEEGESLISKGKFVEGRKKIEQSVFLKNNAYRANMGGAYDDLGGFTTQNQTAALQEIDAIVREKQKEYILQMTPEAAPLRFPLPTTSPLVPQLLPQTNFGFPEIPKLNTPETKKASGGIISGPGTETSDSIPARLSDGEYVVKASAVKKPGVKELLDKINNGNESVLMKAQGGFIGKMLSRFTSNKLNVPNLAGNMLSKFGGNIPLNMQSNIMNMLQTYQQSGLRGAGSSLVNKGLSMIANRIPGASGVMNAISAFRAGGIGGALKSVSKGGMGKLIGGAIGSAIPIPGVGTAIGSLMGSKVGKLVSGLFGRKKKPVAQQIMGALPELGGFAGNLMGRIPGMERFNTEAMFRGMGGSPQAQQAVQAVVDTTGIEQKLNNFINALNNMNIVMDGTKVGKVLVNVTDTASTVGVFRQSAQATL